MKRGTAKSHGAREGGSTHTRKAPRSHTSRSRCAERPTGYADDIVVAGETPFIEAVLLSRGVPHRDLPDVVQEVLLGAWRAMQAGRFHPPLDAPLQHAMRAWLYGIARRQASHYLNVAHRRHETPSGETSILSDAATPVEGQIDARAHLRAFLRLPRECQEVLALAAIGAGAREIARELAIPEGTVNTRIRRGRRLFLRALQRWRKLSTATGRHSKSGDA
jgi:RNA polymerase sigma factor (sigma-70 family)